jgi:hypothetical protein
MADNASYAATPRIGYVQATAANTNRDGTTGTYYSVITGAAGGTRIDRVVMQAAVTTTAGMVRLFIDDGSSVKLYAEVPVAAITASGTVAAFRASIETPDLNLPSSSHVLKANINNAEAMNIFAHGGDY